MAMARLIAAIPGSFVIDYAQINDPAALDALFGFVGSTARAADSSTAFRKQYAGSLEDGFENWGELQDFLSGRRRPARARRRRATRPAERLSRASARITGAIQSSSSASRESSGKRQ